MNQLDSRLDRSVSIFPTRTTINLNRREENPYFEAGLIYHVFRGVTGSGRPSYRAISGWHDEGTSAYWEIGQRVSFFHDQTFRDFGTLRLVGYWAEGVFHGEMPDKRIPLSVLK